MQRDSFATLDPEKFKIERPEYKVQINDILAVDIRNENNQPDAELNVPVVAQGGGAGGNVGQGNLANLYLRGQSVNSDGKISLPNLGEFYVKDLTIKQIQADVEKAVAKFYKQPYVTVRLVNFKVSVLGEVRNPGHYHVFNNQATVLEGISFAGDMLDYANRKEIKLIRQTAEGNEVVLLDLTDSNLLLSKYFYLQPNDQIIVPPLKAKARRLNIPILTAIFGGISTAVLILNFIDRLNTR
ncbi:MAG: polysaccharide biosynthesis/export family protein [Microscillaceae bacterium]|nr:polysaccharide biosynthesis/export family protein [Microscillaceae bacterium]